MEDKLTIQEQIEEYLSTLPKGTIITTGSFKKILSKTYGQPEGSYIPSDYCYNSYCKDSQWDKQRIIEYCWAESPTYIYITSDQTTH